MKEKWNCGTFSSAKSMFEQYFKDGVLYSSSILIHQKIYGLLEIDIYPLTNEIRKRMKRVKYPYEVFKACFK